MKPIEENKNSLPDNAFRELKEGEEYVPLMKPEEKHREVTAWSVTWGIIMAIVFSAATAYLGLKVGQVQGRRITLWHQFSKERAVPSCSLSFCFHAALSFILFYPC